jgi:hypothetical protein
MQIQILDKRTLLITYLKLQFIIGRAYDNAPVCEMTEVLAYRKMRGKQCLWVVTKKACDLLH